MKGFKTTESNISTIENMQDPIIILGTGRCGSTLLQRILNTSEKITIWGEHEGFLAKLAESYYILTESEGMKKNFYSQEIDPTVIMGALTDYSASPNWTNSFNQSIIHDNYRVMIANLLNNHLNIEEVAWGFKEIRYSQNDRAMDMWFELFPHTRLIFSVRNPFDVIRSMIIDWSDRTFIEKIIKENDRDRIRQLLINYAVRWNNVISSFQFWIENQKFNYYVEKYEDLMAQPEKNVKSIFNFLNSPVPETALNPLSVKIGSKKSLYKEQISEFTYIFRDDIWKIVGASAQHFHYDLVMLQNSYSQ